MLGAPDLSTGLQVGSHESRAEEVNHPPCPAGPTAIDHLAFRITLFPQLQQLWKEHHLTWETILQETALFVLEGEEGHGGKLGYKAER